MAAGEAADPRQREYVRDGWNITGDTYVREPDGYFRYVARADDMIVSAGYNIAGPEVEDALLRHPDVVEAAVVLPGRGAGAGGGGVRRAAGGRRAGPGGAAGVRQAGVGAVQASTGGRLPDALPRTATGKLQRFRLSAAARTEGDRQ
ncbi:AMP-dependent synthetase OS=Streptomyces fumanus OX=67302 GN=GCM10018772_38950 PE=4 SV=1 [Streptomyces fumanus]